MTSDDNKDEKNNNVKNEENDNSSIDVIVNKNNDEGDIYLKEENVKDEKSDGDDYICRDDKNDKAYKVNSNIKKNIKIGKMLSIIQSLFTIIILILIIKLNIIPTKYMIPLLILLIVSDGLILFTQFSGKCSKLGKLFSIFIIFILIVCSIYLFKIENMFSTISSAGVKVDEISVIVLKNDNAKNLKDVADYTLGIQQVIDRNNTDKTIQILSDILGSKIKTKYFLDFNSQVEALYIGEVSAIVINEAFRENIIEIFSDFNEMTKVLTGQHIETIVDLKNEVENVKNENFENKVTNETFMIYISGIDTYGPISSTSRSDVNIIATINPSTKQILLTTTPRDYYVLLPNTDGQMDKLTHAGIYGVDVSIKTLENLYNISIDYYVRINFKTLIDLVDALGGITVESEFAFNSEGYSFLKGENQLNGEEALVFSRERYSFANGDNQRGKNQMQVIKSLVNKAISPVNIKNAMSIIDTISKNFETNMTSNEISSLIKMQINDGASWDIIMNSVSGTGDSRTTYSGGKQLLYVMIPDQASVDEAKEKMKQVKEK